MMDYKHKINELSFYFINKYSKKEINLYRNNDELFLSVENNLIEKLSEKFPRYKYHYILRLSIDTYDLESYKKLLRLKNDLNKIF